MSVLTPDTNYKPSVRGQVYLKAAAMAKRAIHYPVPVPNAQTLVRVPDGDVLNSSTQVAYEYFRPLRRAKAGLAKMISKKRSTR